MRRSWLIFAVIALIGAVMIVRLVEAPGYTDVHYHYNAAVRLATGQGFTEPYLWTYIGAPDRVPESGVFPSHLYWMPLTSVISAAGLRLFGGDYAAAQFPSALMLAGTALIGFGLGHRIGGSARHAWIAGLLTLLSGFFTRFWGAVDTFAPFALFGSACLVAFGANLTPSPEWRGGWGVRFALTGALAGLSHLTRADGVLLLIVGIFVLLFSGHRRRFAFILAAIIGYGAVMTPWFIRNLSVIGTPLSLGGTQAIWLRAYDDLFNYPPINTPADLFADGLTTFIGSRWGAFVSNLGTFVAVEGMIVLVPLMLFGLYRRRKDPFLRPFWLYALGLHLAFTLIFPFPGYRGGLLHSAAALIPFWAALGAVGLDDVIGWIAARRRWRAESAKRVFAAALVLYAVGLSAWIGSRGRVIAPTAIPTLYQRLIERLPEGGRVMINDPALLYGLTGLGGVVIPNESPDVIAEIAERYAVDYVVIEPGGLPVPMTPILTDPPPFLHEIERVGDVVIYEVRR